MSIEKFLKNIKIKKSLQKTKEKQKRPLIYKPEITWLLVASHCF